MTTVLLVEDDPAARQGLELALLRLGYQVRPAGTGEAALDGIRQGAVDVVVLDVMLPGVDGFEVCRRLRRGSDVPVIMLTARGDDFDIVGGLEAGADDYVVKPVEPRVLDARIRAVLRRLDRAGSPAETYGELVIDRSSLTVARRGREISLTPPSCGCCWSCPGRRGRYSPGSSCSTWYGNTATSATPGWSTPAYSGCGRRSKPTRPSRATSRRCAGSATGSGRCSSQHGRNPWCVPA